MAQIIHQKFTVRYDFPIIFTKNVFREKNTTLLDIIAQGGRLQSKALVIIDSDIVHVNPDLLKSIESYAEVHNHIIRLVAQPILVRGGEACKNDQSAVSNVHGLVKQYKICRHSFIIAIGGGAMLDMVGYAAATAHRGIRLIRLPTTVLAQNDAGVGVKNGINAFGRKNFIGTFAPPFAVINDAAFLRSLPERDLRAGIAEAVKVSLIQDREFFNFLYLERYSLSAFMPAVMEKMIFRCAQLHVRHIGYNNDPFERGSSRPLDFGHWIAHKLEECSNGEIRHGEAVAIGIAIDSLYSNRVGLLNKQDLDKILGLLETLGFKLYHPSLLQIDLGEALEGFREHLGGDLSIPLLKGIGQKINAPEINVQLMSECISKLASVDFTISNGTKLQVIPCLDNLKKTVVDIH